jgi:glutamate carboxypeptidase
MDATAILNAADQNKGWLQDTLRELVQQESPSEDREAVNAAVDLVELWSRNMGGRAKRHRQRQFGDVLELRFGPTRSPRKPVLLLGHLDTVWPLGTLKTMPWRNAEGRLWGPGVLDMKAGVVMALTAIQTLQQLS